LSGGQSSREESNSRGGEENGGTAIHDCACEGYHPVSAFAICGFEFVDSLVQSPNMTTLIG
jgi:hypothetical protein